MSKPLMPTCNLRWAIRDRAFERGGDAVATRERVLQQMFLKPNGGQVWRDVPEVMEADDE